MSTNEGYVYRDRVRAADAGASVLDYHVARYRHSDAETWRRSIECGRVRVNGRSVSPAERLRSGDQLEFHRPPWSEPEAPLAFEVVFEDEQVLVVAKPAGLQVLPAGPFLERTLSSQVRASDPGRATSAPVHRLGRGTSGLVLFGKTPLARAFLSHQFRERTPRKTYLAIAAGCGLPGSCVARHRIGRVPHGPLHIHCAKSDGKTSVTRLRVLARDRVAQRSLVAAQPITGRPDQIRIHLAACGAPLAGDRLFGFGGVPVSDARPGDGGYLLHAASLRFEHPATRRRLKLRSLPAWLPGFRRA